MNVTINTPAQRPEPKPNINKGKASSTTLIPPHWNDIYMKANEGRSEPEIKKIASILDEFKDVFSKDDGTQYKYQFFKTIKTATQASTFGFGG